MILTISEGRVLCDAVKQNGAILQVGSQQRSDFSFRRASEIVRNGWIGKIREVQVYLGDFGPPELLPEDPFRTDSTTTAGSVPHPGFPTTPSGYRLADGAGIGNTVRA